MEKDALIQVGGDIEESLKGNYTINVKAIINEAWALTKQSRVSINLGVLFCLFLSGMLFFLVANYFGDVKATVENPQANFAVNILITLLVSPFLVAIEMMGIFHAVGIKTQPKTLFAFLKKGSLVAVCALLSSMLISLGFSLLVFPGLYLLVALSLVLPLVVEKGFTPFKAITVSIKVTRFKWLSIFSVYSILFIGLVISFIPLILLANTSFQIIGGMFFFLSMSYLAPMFYNVKGILYREMFGMKLAIKASDTISQDNIFSA
ncbi:hypothetical protein [Thalassotalea piscium]|uniref:Uncharacterized protein n=1 Tax=Thalassotalea piscium TaxID=1230533 RepID=A0A7X0NF52_9GAMM|nr:hypothetical protein [Thalassotalea piscium]MBB6542198.1 hypothetical protein [Thalassotalea piscium]